MLPYRRAGFVGERGNLYGPDFPPRFPMLAVAVQRDRPANWLFALSSYQPPDDLALRVLDPLAGLYGKELHERRKLRRYLCSELGANLVEPEGRLICRDEPRLPVAIISWVRRWKQGHLTADMKSNAVRLRLRAAISSRRSPG